MIAMPNALSLHARHFPFGFFTLSTKRSFNLKTKLGNTPSLWWGTHCFECMLALNAGQTPKAHVLYDEHKNTTCAT